MIMNPSIFIHWTDAVNFLNEKIKKNKLIAGYNVKLEDTGYGIMINCMSGNSKAQEYSGMLKTVQTADDKIKLVDGFDDTAGYCAVVYINGFKANVLSSELTITADCVIYLESVLVGNPATGATAIIKQAASMPDPEAGKAFSLISRVTFANSKITDFSRENVPLNIYIIGGCS
jgi:hypothetical protein